MFSSGIPNSGKLSFGPWRFRNLDDQRDAQPLIDHYRRTKRDRVTDSLDDKMPVVENKESAGRRPDEQALLGELSGQVQSALTRLSPELREAVILRDLQQLEYSEIQQVLAVPEGTVKIENQSRTHRTGAHPATDGSASVVREIGIRSWRRAFYELDM